MTTRQQTQLHGVISALFTARRKARMAIERGYADSQQIDQLLTAAAEACDQAHKALVTELRASDGGD